MIYFAKSLTEEKDDGLQQNQLGGERKCSTGVQAKAEQAVALSDHVHRAGLGIIVFAFLPGNAIHLGKKQI